MDHIFGSGDFRYEAVPDWGRLPEGWSLKEVAAVAVDSQDRVYAFSRGEHPICVFDREGKFLTSWARACSAARMACIWGPTTSSGAPMTATTPSANARWTDRCC